ncbi:MULTISPECIES: hypothetical protein [unclassified Arthrobacter]|uniref:hypothetical protein n=1 Tax=unclassified Arthrobacter TaxID=235627 RepID=UPI002E06712D|nr:MULTISPECIES: hypothetical protein [unclassified Arthrobacter]MEC5192987.1 hypothetical protein [Arthrobacter sp. MP_M4]MEC5204505.1 hypothetical protein [Arthrobacter sp. MP_M7]
MTTTPSPAPVPVEVLVHSVPAEWWQVLAALGPLAVLVSAAIAAVIGINTLKQKSVADNRAEWWKRAQWALDAVHSGNKKQAAVGLKVLRVLGESELAGAGELAVLEAAWQGHGAHAPAPPNVLAPGAADGDLRAVWIAAAQLRLVTDQRLNKQTPEWVRTLAADDP